MKYFTSCFWYWWRFPARAQTHRAVQHIPRWLIGRALSMVCFQVIIWKAWPWTIECNMFGECHTPCRPNTSFVDFEKKEYCSCYKRLHFSSLPNSSYIYHPYPTLHTFFVPTQLFIHFSSLPISSYIFRPYPTRHTFFVPTQLFILFSSLPNSS